MAQCKQTPYEFVQNAFSPLVAVLSSPAADQLCRKNNLSFIEMVQPFCKLASDVHFRDPVGASVTVKNLRVCIQDVHSRPPQPTLARKFLNESVSSAINDCTTIFAFGHQKIEIPASTPWFEAWRETFLQVQFPAEHEFTKHFLGCVVVVSAAEPSPTEAVRALRQQLQSLQSVAPGKLPKWMATPSPPLTCHLLLHDVIEGDAAKAEEALSQMKAKYGANNCFLLNINSRPLGQHEDINPLPDPWSQFLCKHTDTLDISEHDSSPRTPAEISGLSGMPTRVSMEDTEVAQEVHEQVPEIVQETGATSPVPVLQHPLSPQEEGYHFPDPDKGGIMNHLTGSAPLNTNVWAGSTQTTSSLTNNHLLPHGACLTAPDLDRIRAFIQDMCAHALLPHIEKQIQQLNDQISNKKSVSRSLLGATKRWFGTNKPGAPNSNVPTNAVIYSSDAPELQVRRMGDLCFMFRHYKLAYEAYHSAKRDFAADGAWLYYAGALEMASLSAFMMGESSRKAQEYSEEAILTYLNTCRLQQFATRGTLLSTECLKSRAQYADAAKQLLRMTSEDSDLRSALLLEQAALCYLSASKPPMIRKFAFHMVLAGHRFIKAGQKRHSLRCYQLAYQVYKGKGWSLAEDHIHFTLGRQAANLRQPEVSVQAFARLFTPMSKQSPVQQAAFLREYLLSHQQSPLEAGVLPVLPLPFINNSSLAVLVGPMGSSTQHGPSVTATGMLFADDSPDFANSWSQLEEKLLTEAQGSTLMIFKPAMVLFTNQTDNSVRPTSILGEPVSVSVSVENPMGIPLPLSNVHLLWAFRPAPNCDDSVDDAEKPWTQNESSFLIESESCVQTCILPELLLEPSSTRQLVLSVVPRHVGNLNILGIAYRINYPAATTDGAPLTNSMLVNSSVVPTSSTPITLSVQGKQLFALEAKRVLRFGKERPSLEKKMEDHRLELLIVPCSPQLLVKLTGLPYEMLCGELQKVEVELSNVGSIPIKNLLVGSDTPNLFSIADLPLLGNSQKGVPQVQRVPLPDMLYPQQHTLLTLWLRAPDSPGTAHLRILFYYDSGESISVPRYRLVKHSWPLNVLESIQLSAEANRSQALNAQEVVNVNMRVTNSNRVQDLLLTKVTVMQVSLASTSWLLNSIPFSPLQQDTVLSSQESIQFLLRMSRRSKQNPPIFTDVKVASASGISVEPSGNRPYRDFVQRHSEWCAVANPPLESLKSTNTALSLNAAIILRWTAAVMDSGGAVRAAIGQTHIVLSKLNMRRFCPPLSQLSAEKSPAILKIFGPERNVPSESDLLASKAVLSLETMQQLVAYSLQHQARISHDFTRQRLCIVNVQLILHNCCDSPIFVKVNLATSPSGMPSKSQLYLPHASSVVRWVGRLVSHIELEGRCAHTLPLLAAIPGPGTYNLGAHLQIFCRMLGAPEKDTIPQRMRIESAVVVGQDETRVN